MLINTLHYTFCLILTEQYRFIVWNKCTTGASRIFIGDGLLKFKYQANTGIFKIHFITNTWTVDTTPK